MSTSIGVRAFAPHQVWPHVGSRWPAWNVESDQAEGLVFWMPLHGSDVLRSVYADIIAGRIFTPTGTPAWVGDSMFGTALLFDDGAPEYLTLASGVVTSYPLTMTCWINADDDTTWTCPFYLGNAGATNYHQLVFRGNIDDKVAAVSYDGTTGAAVSSVAATVNNWHQICGIFPNSTSRAILLDGANKGTNTTDVTPASIVETCIATRTGAQHFSGRIADARIYDRALSDSLGAELYDRETRRELYEIPRHLWAMRWVAAPTVGQPMSLRGTTVPHLRQWHPRVG